MCKNTYRMDVATNVALIKTGVTSFKSFLRSKQLQTNLPEQILDPLSTMIRLGLLAFYEKGTKISIANNTLATQPPGIFQGPTRWSSGSKRTELHLLFKPIIRALKHYDMSKNKAIDKIFKLAIQGIQKLKSAYPDASNVTLYSLNFYVHTIQKGGDDNELLEILEVEKDLNVFGELWSDKDIQLVSILIDKLVQHRREIHLLHHYNRALIHVLEVKDAKVRALIKETTAKM